MAVWSTRSPTSRGRCTRCPWPSARTTAVTIPRARRAAALGLVDVENLEEQRSGWSLERLLGELDATRPAREELVVCHGDLCLPNVLLDPDTLAVTGIVDVGRLGRADRYADLALATRSLSDTVLNPQYGPAYAARFLDRYGEAPIDGDRMDFYRLLDEFF